MASKKKISDELRLALAGQKQLSIDLYVEALAAFEQDLKDSLNRDADDALLCVLADSGDVAMMVIDWDGRIYRNENALRKLHAMWRNSFDANVKKLLPIFSDHIHRKNLGYPASQASSGYQQETLEGSESHGVRRQDNGVEILGINTSPTLVGECRLLQQVLFEHNAVDAAVA